MQCVKCLHVSFWIGHYVAYPVSVTSELQGDLFYVRIIASGVYRDLFVFEGREDMGGRNRVVSTTLRHGVAAHNRTGYKSSV